MTVVAFDASCTAKPQRTGVGRYAACLLDALIPRLAARGDTSVTLGYRLSRWRRASFRYRHAAACVRERWFLDALAAPLLGHHDVFHGLDARLPRGLSGKSIATLHDVGAIAERDISSAGFRDKKFAAYRDLQERADRIVCVSQATRDAFRALFPAPESKFAVVHHGLEPRFAPPDAESRIALRARLELPERYILFVGLLSSRKNLTVLVEAFSRLASRDSSLWLVLAGGRAHGSDAVDAAIERSAHRDRIWAPGYVSDADLPALYAEARAFVFPGLAEGFGMPMLEAMACGAPVIAADRPVTHEVAGDAAVTFDGADSSALAATIERVIADSSERSTLLARGMARAAEFSWDAAALRTLSIYDELAGAPQRATSTPAQR
jgi:glycosyltransferase involved in cell wall biosynthesis